MRPHPPRDTSRLLKARRKCLAPLALLLCFGSSVPAAQPPASSPTPGPVRALGGVFRDRVLFASNRGGKDRFNIMVMRLDGSGRRFVTRGRSLHFDPVWSPDGRKIACTDLLSVAQTRAAIFVMDADGSRRRQLTRKARFAYSPTWSPDGNRIALSCSAERPGTRLGIVGADGGDERLLEDGDDPAWSPDGSRLLFSGQTRPDRERQLLQMDASDFAAGRAGEVPVAPAGPRVTPLPTGSAGGGAWSPDGRRVAYSGHTPDGPVGLFVMPVDGSAGRRLTATWAFEFGVQWTPDGERLLFTRRVESGTGEVSWEIWSCRPDGMFPLRLTTGRAADVTGHQLWTVIGFVRVPGFPS